MGRQTRRPKKERRWSGRAMVRCGLAVCLQWVARSPVVVESLRGGSEGSAGKRGGGGVTGCVTKRRRGQGEGLPAALRLACQSMAASIATGANAPINRGVSLRLITANQLEISLGRKL